MRILLVILACGFIAVAAVFGAYEYFGYRRYNSFIVPFTQKLIARRILTQERGTAILREDRISHIIGMALSLLVGILMSLYIAGIPGYIVYVLAAGGLIVFVKPDMVETTATRSAYFGTHRNDMDERRYHEYLVEVGDTAD